MKYEELSEKEKKDYDLIVKYGAFNKEYYMKEYNLDENIDPIAHFLKIGANKGYNPAPYFDTKFYLDVYGDVKNSQINPLIHFLMYGITENRIPKSLTSDEIKRLNIKKENVNDYLVIRNSGEFDYGYYITNYKINKEINPIVHFLETGAEKGFNPSPNFDIKFYLDQYDEIIKGMNPFAHYLKYSLSSIMTPKVFSIEELLEKGLKKTLKGKTDFLFLFNDTDNEIRQHFDFNYKNKFDKEKFLEKYYSKKEVFDKNKIKYVFFDIPDKSMVCKNFLPIPTDKYKRNVDSIDEIIDFIDYLNINHYYKLDNNLNFWGSEILSFKILNFIDNKFKITEWNRLLNENSKLSTEPAPNDLLTINNWSYSQRGRRIIKKKNEEPKDKIVKPKTLLQKQTPSNFQKYGDMDSVYFENQNSFSNKRALIIHDSGFDTLKWYFSFYFREMFLCWNPGIIPEELISILKPDVIIEARIERTIDNLYTSV